HFFSPEELYEFRSLEELATFEIPKANHKRMHQHNPNNLSLQAKISKDEYLDCVRDIIKHIKLGNIYEVNFAQEFVVRNVQIDPVRLFIKFLDHSNAPFSAFYKIGDHYAICGSPERFIKGKGDRICSEPIKGTIRTSVNPLENEALIDQLLHSSKDRSENIMAVDVVRNDLSRTAEKGSVVVTDLCRLETFQKVHHLISSIESKRKKGMTNVDVIQHAFPMASMTGAPKISAMKYIERYENFRRGLYSGSIGYFDLENDSFDFNVVIRTIQYDASKHILSFATGGAITALSNPEEEYQECFVKAKSIMQTLFD
ncbi:MAG: anthranilate synthase component I family protein, partial [Flavobacteriales bacterium]|nr:anthranilate synthase component I family protein [Flavobacteriales bacterium]